MKPVVCHKATKRAPALLLAVSALAAAQTSPDWRKVGGASVELSLASPATGPVDRVWFCSGGVLCARRIAGKFFQTPVSESWIPAPSGVEAPFTPPATAVRLPESGAQILTVA